MDTNDLIGSYGSKQVERSGCPCRDARIVSHRRARFFAHLARTKGETADRVIPAEAGWTIPPDRSDPRPT